MKIIKFNFMYLKFNNKCDLKFLIIITHLKFLINSKFEPHSRLWTPKPETFVIQK